jgi:hypothetical protein
MEAILGVPELTAACWLQARESLPGRKGGDCDQHNSEPDIRLRHFHYTLLMPALLHSI